MCSGDKVPTATGIRTSSARCEHGEDELVCLEREDISNKGGSEQSPARISIRGDESQFARASC